MTEPAGLRRRIVELLEHGPAPTHDIAAELRVDLHVARLELAHMADARQVRSNARGWHLRHTYNAHAQHPARSHQ